MKIQYNPHISGLRESTTIAINQQSKRLMAQGYEITRFGFGESPFPVPQELQQALAENTHRKEYLPSLGLLQLREALQGYFKKKYNVHWGVESIAIGPGSKMLLYLIQYLLEAPLILPTPAWVSYLPQATLLGKEVHLLPTAFEDKWTVKADRLDAFVTSLQYEGCKLMILNSPNNPSGQSLRELEALSQVCKKHKILVISDEIYAPLHFSGSPKTLSHLIPEQVIVTGGLSKAWASGGYRLGFAAGPPSMRDLFAKLAVLISETYTAASSPIQYAALSVWRDHVCSVDQYVDDCAQILKQGLELAQTALTKSGIRCHPSTGGFYLFPEYSNFRETLSKRGIRNSSGLSSSLLNDGKVASLPASDFGIEKSLATRLAIINYDGTEALKNYREGIPLQQTFKPIILGCQKIHNWLHK